MASASTRSSWGRGGRRHWRAGHRPAAVSLRHAACGIAALRRLGTVALAGLRALTRDTHSGTKSLADDQVIMVRYCLTTNAGEPITAVVMIRSVERHADLLLRITRGR